jgi:Carbohydrate binding domain
MMRRNLLFGGLSVLGIMGTLCFATRVVTSDDAKSGRVYPDRWVFVSRSLRQDGDVEVIRRLAETAGQHGITGMVLSGSFDSMDLQPPEYFTRLEAVKTICAQNHLEIIPQIFSVGYGGAVKQHDLNLAEGLHVENARFVARNGEARLEPEADARIANGGFEEAEGDRLKQFAFNDRPGELTFVDTKTFKEGRASLRLEAKAGADPQNVQSRAMQEVGVTPRRSYRLSAWVKTEGLQPATAFRIQVLAGNRSLAPVNLRTAGTSDWHRISVLFNSMTFDHVRLYAGVWRGRAGTAWIDDLRLEEVGPVNVLRRPGTPVTVGSDDGQTLYAEGKDYAPLVDPQLNPSRTDHEAPPLRLLPSGRIHDGDRLRVSWYHPVPINDGQVGICMSEPKVYEIWRTQARLLRQHLNPRKYFLNMDEVRHGGTCAACKSRNMSMAQILGDCFTRQAALLREATPGADIYVWSDMLDPNHNAHGDYYLVEGDYTGSWKYVPKDLIIACWYYQKREASLKFFSDLGFRTLAGAYYDGDNLDNPRGWLEALDRTPKAQGIMYTTWVSKYDLLPAFGDLVARR